MSQTHNTVDNSTDFPEKKNSHENGLFNNPIKNQVSKTNASLFLPPLDGDTMQDVKTRLKRKPPATAKPFVHDLDSDDSLSSDDLIISAPPKHSKRKVQARTFTDDTTEDGYLSTFDGSQFSTSTLQQENEQNADFDTARLVAIQYAININTKDREQTYNMFRQLSTALGEHKGQESKYSGWINKALDNGICSKIILAGGIAAVAGPVLHALGDKFDFSNNFTNDSGGNMLMAFLILAAVAGMVKILENYLKRDDKEVVQGLKANLQSGLKDLMDGKEVDIEKLDNMAKEIISLCPDGKGFIAEYEQFKDHARHVDEKDSIMAGDSKVANQSLLKQGSKVEQKVMSGSESDIKKIKNRITMSNTSKTAPTAMTNGVVKQQKRLQ